MAGPPARAPFGRSSGHWGRGGAWGQRSCVCARTPGAGEGEARALGGSAVGSRGAKGRSCLARSEKGGHEISFQALPVTGQSSSGTGAVNELSLLPWHRGGVPCRCLLSE